LRAFRFNRTAIVATVGGALAATLLGLQLTLSVNGEARANPSADESALAFQRINVPSAVVQQQLYMPAATQVGQFEDIFKPKPVELPSGPIVWIPRPDLTLAPEPVQDAASIPTKPPVYESGIASTYGTGDGFEGLRTGCGQIFRTGIVQVAHKSLPCGTVVRVEDVDTGKSVEAEVTDRGPYVSGRIVDLSWAAFRELDPSGPGLLRVKVYVVDTSNQYLYRLR
jgi:hypothetical protein